jgi:hypothetical protein
VNTPLADCHDLALTILCSDKVLIIHLVCSCDIVQRKKVLHRYISEYIHRKNVRRRLVLPISSVTKRPGTKTLVITHNLSRLTPNADA